MNPRLIPDQSAAVARQLLDPSSVAELLNTYAGQNVEHVTLTRCWPRAAKSLIVEWLIDSDEGESRWYGQFNTKHMGRSFMPEDLPNQAHWIRDLGLLIHRADSDPAMPHLSRCLSISNGSSSWLDRVNDPEPLVSQIRGYKPGRRATIEYTLRHTPYAIGKTFATADGGKLAGLHSRINEALASRNTSTRVAPCVAYDPELNLTVFPAVQGTHPHELDVLVRPLADLHSIAVDGLPSFEVSDELAVVRRWIEAVLWLEPNTAPLCQPALDTLHMKAIDLSEQPRRTIHRDYYDKQVIHDDDRITVIDLDTLAVGSPWLDLGNLIAHQLLHELTCGARDAFARPLLRATAETYPTNDSTVDEQALQFFTATSLLRLGAVHRFRSATTQYTEALWRQAVELLSSPMPWGARNPL